MAQYSEEFTPDTIMPAVTRRTLEKMKGSNHSFYTRLSALLDYCGVEEKGAGRQGWIAYHGEVTRVSVKGWEQGRRAREGNIETLASAIAIELPTRCSESDIYEYLRGDRPDINVSGELTKLGLEMPVQAWFLNLINEEMTGLGLSPTEPKNYGIWSSSAVLAAEFYAKHINMKDPLPESRIRHVMRLFIGLCEEGAI
ncbi:MAG: hypothetical protein V7742_14140 [Halioglobus sp.]